MHTIDKHNSVVIQINGQTNTVAVCESRTVAAQLASYLNGGAYPKELNPSQWHQFREQQLITLTGEYKKPNAQRIDLPTDPADYLNGGL